MITLAFVLGAGLKATLVLGLAGLVARTLRHGSAATRHLVWTLGVVAALLLPTLRAFTPRWEVPLLPAGLLTAQPAAPVGAGVPLTVPTAHAVSHVTDPDPRPLPLPTAPPRPRTFGSTLLVLLWLAGVLTIAIPLLLGAGRVWWLGRRGADLDSPGWSALAEDIAASLGLTRRVRLLQGRPRGMPMAWGVFRAVVLLPEDADEWPEARRRSVLTHELAHVKRHDCLTQALAHAACAAYWFNPLVWIAARRLRVERERACDDLVLRCGANGPDYADHLLQLARGARSSGEPLWAAVAMARPSQLEGRLLAILDPSLDRRGPSRQRAQLGVAAAVFLVVPLAGLEPGASPVLAARPQEAAHVEAAYAAQATPASQPAPSAPTKRKALKQEPQSRDSAPEPEPADHDGAPPPSDRVVAALAGALHDPDGEVRKQAVFSLGQLHAASAAPALAASLGDTDGEVRAQAAFALGQIRSEAAVGALTAALRDPEAEVRQQAVFALGQIRATSAVDGLIAAIKDSNEEVRQQAVFALGEIRDERAVAPLVSALADADAEVRQQAAFALGQIRNAEAVPALVGALKDHSAEVREQAAFALGQVGDERAADALTAALKDAEVDVRRQAAFALGQLAR